MLFTNEMEKYLKAEIEKKMEDVDWSGINFAQATTRSPEGVYMYSQNGKYNMTVVEKGMMRPIVSTTSIEDMLFECIKFHSRKCALEYATKNYDGQNDFRRLLFQKEIEIFSLFDNAYCERREQEINAILEKNPFIDSGVR